MHIGQKIKEIFTETEHKHSVIWLAERLNCTRTNIYDIFERESLDTALLERISKILNHDFFQDLSAEYKRTATK